MRNDIPKRTPSALLHTFFSKLFDIPVGFVTTFSSFEANLLWLQSPNGGDIGWIVLYLNILLSMGNLLVYFDHREEYRSCAWSFCNLVQIIPFKNCTLTNKADVTIWRALSKPPQMRQGPDPRPILLIETARSTAYILMDGTRYFDILLYYYICVCTTFLWPLCFGWLLVLSRYKEDSLQFSKCVTFYM